MKVYIPLGRSFRGVMEDVKNFFGDDIEVVVVAKEGDRLLTEIDDLFAILTFRMDAEGKVNFGEGATLPNREDIVVINGGMTEGQEAMNWLAEGGLRCRRCNLQREGPQWLATMPAAAAAVAALNRLFDSYACCGSMGEDIGQEAAKVAKMLGYPEFKRGEWLPIPTGTDAGDCGHCGTDRAGGERNSLTGVIRCPECGDKDV